MTCAADTVSAGSHSRDELEMESISTLTMDLPRLLGLAIALAGGLLAAASYLRRHRHQTTAALQRVATVPAAAGKIIYHDAPTVRVAESQRVDRVRKLARLAPGEYIDVLENRGSPVPRFRVTLKAIGQRDDGPTAHIVVSFGGTQVSCGPAVEEVGNNEFILPRTGRDEPRAAVFHYHERGDALDFMRIKLRGIDAQSGAAEIDLMQVSGNWLRG
jgi:hypothetical protein